MNLDFLKPKPGDDVEAWWSGVVEWAKTLAVEIGPGMRVSQMAGGGLRILMSDDTTVRTPFRVGLSGRRVTVSTGFLGTQVPYLISGDLMVRLDATGPDGVTPDPGGRPSLDLSDAVPGDDERSAIVVRVRLDANGVPIDDIETPEALQVVHLPKFDPAEKRRLMREESVAIQELAILYWTGDEPQRAGQVVRHNLKFSFAPSSQDDGVGRPFFSAV